jgi:hypothetical protein
MNIPPGVNLTAMALALTPEEIAETEHALGQWGHIKIQGFKVGAHQSPWYRTIRAALLMDSDRS